MGGGAPEHGSRRGLLLAAGGALVLGAAAWVARPRPARGAASDYEGSQDMYAALRRGPATTLQAGASRIRVVFADGAPGLDRGRVLAWVRTGAAAVTTYFGRFPPATYGLLVIAGEGSRVGHATTWGYDGAATRVTVGRDAGEAAFGDDWVMTHEMVHASLPGLPRRALWLLEGEATWLEPVARAQAGQIGPDEVWSQAVKGMARGQPRPGDGGMDGTQAWGRLYWGGATFWLQAEIALHEATGGRAGLRDAMRAIAAQSGGNVVEWSPERMMRTGDAAVGGEVLSRLYARWIAGPMRPNLDAMFARLGVSMVGDAVRYDDRAPLAALRRKLTAVERG